MKRCFRSVLVASLTIMAAPPAWALQETFKDKLGLNPDETCTTGIPAPGDIIVLALKGAKGNHYVGAGNPDVPRLAVRGKPTTVFQIFQFAAAATEGTVALYSLGHQKFVEMDEKTRLFATADPAAALLFELQDAGGGYFRIKVHKYNTWMRMNENGYLDFRAKQVEQSDSFCAQIVQSE